MTLDLRDRHAPTHVGETRCDSDARLRRLHRLADVQIPICLVSALGRAVLCWRHRPCHVTRLVTVPRIPRGFLYSSWLGWLCRPILVGSSRPSTSQGIRAWLGVTRDRGLVQRCCIPILQTPCRADLTTRSRADAPKSGAPLNANVRAQRMRKVMYYWAVTTLLLCAAYVVYVRTQPPDELVMANTLLFQIIVSIFVVGGPCLVVLFLWLFFGSIWRSLRSNRAFESGRAEERRAAQRER